VADAQEVYRCTECGHGKHLAAWGNASVHGPLSAAGEIESYDWDDLWEVHEDSIQCARHPDMVLEKLIGGRWCRWWACSRCDGKTRDDHCPENGIHPADGDGKQIAHAGWWPSDEPWPVSTLDRGGHVFTPGRNAYCRYCRVIAGSTSAQKLECEGDNHQCPMVVEEGTGEPARQIYGGDDWVCFQSGKMNGDFTEWRCGSGHAITRAGHIPPGRRHEDVCNLATWRCPWDFLMSGEVRHA
jgi:hypothetical protein